MTKEWVRIINTTWMRCMLSKCMSKKQCSNTCTMRGRCNNTTTWREHMMAREHSLTALNQIHLSCKIPLRSKLDLLITRSKL